MTAAAAAVAVVTAIIITYTFQTSPECKEIV